MFLDGTWSNKKKGGQTVYLQYFHLDVPDLRYGCLYQTSQPPRKTLPGFDARDDLYFFYFYYGIFVRFLASQEGGMSLGLQQMSA